MLGALETSLEVPRPGSRFRRQLGSSGCGEHLPPRAGAARPKLGATIAATRSEHLTFLVTDCGKPYTPAGFGNAMRDWCDQANLHHCSAHGLRKACATGLAEAGATAHEVASVTGRRLLQSEHEQHGLVAHFAKLGGQRDPSLGHSAQPGHDRDVLPAAGLEGHRRH